MSSYLRYLRDNGRLQQDTWVAVTTNAQYRHYTELGLAELLANDFPEITSLRVIVDETGKRTAEKQLDEIARLLRNLGKYIKSKAKTTETSAASGDEYPSTT
jgi:hypothetical protein